jgi:adenine-specific DNA-methyltransferase
MPRRGSRTSQQAESYQHPTAESVLRPDIGTQAQFRKKKPPQTYRYDSSLAPSLEWDGQNAAREEAEALIQKVLDADTLEEAKSAVAKLKAVSKPFLNWAGKAERLSFDVPTLPLFVHERLSTKAILETLKGHKRDRQLSLLDLFGDPQHPIYEQVLRAYEHRDNWTNRLILGDSLAVMNSLLSYEGLGGQVQMIYMDPPYGVSFGSNFQPFIRKRDVTHNDDEDMTREPEMVKAYRDTWELGLHSYLTYLRDRLLLCRELLASSGSVFVQISDENLHHVREIMDEVFGAENFVSLIAFAKTTGFSGNTLSSVADYILWYARSIQSIKYRQLYRFKEAGDEGATKYRAIETITAIPKGLFDPMRLATSDQLTSQGALVSSEQEFHF